MGYSPGFVDNCDNASLVVTYPRGVWMDIGVTMDGFDSIRFLPPFAPRRRDRITISRPHRFVQNRYSDLPYE